MNYTLYSYDVVGNQQEGYKISSKRKLGTLEIENDLSQYSKREILELIDAVSSVDIDDAELNSFGAVFIDRETLKPLGELCIAPQFSP